MKLFLDTANRAHIKQWIPTGIVDGVTTNPTLLSKEGSNTKEILLDICNMLPAGDISIEVVEKTPDAVYKQAKQIAQLADNVVVKIPFAQEYLPVISMLTRENVRLNITLIFSAIQALMVAKLGVEYISPFVGRVDDIAGDGSGLIEEITDLISMYDFDTEVLAASIRTMTQWRQAMENGAHAITVPPALLEQAMHHPLTIQGIERFDQDWLKLGKKQLLD